MQSGPWVRIHYAPAWLNWPNRGAKIDAPYFRIHASRIPAYAAPLQGVTFRITEEREEDVDIEWI